MSPLIVGLVVALLWLSLCTTPADAAVSEAKGHHHKDKQRRPDFLKKSPEAVKAALDGAKMAHSFLTDPDARWWMIPAALVCICVIGYCFLFALTVVVYGSSLVFGFVKVPFKWTNWLVWKLLALLFWPIYQIYIRCCSCGRRGATAHSYGGGGDYEGEQYTTELTAIGDSLEIVGGAGISTVSEGSSQACSANGCPYTRARSKNGVGLVFVGAMCTKHLNLQHGEHADELTPYERQPTKYLCNYRFLQAPMTELSFRAYVLNAWREAGMRNKRKAGYIYIFHSTYDEPRRLDKDGKFLYKIGETTLPHARERIAQWDDHHGDVVFTDVEGVGWWRTKDAAGAEAIIHATLVCDRIVRFNNLSKHEEVEWFEITYATAKTTIETVLEQINRDTYFPKDAAMTSSCSTTTPTAFSSRSSSSESEIEKSKTVSDKTK
jgi:hypothetical protein